MNFDTSDTVISILLWIPVVVWSVIYSVGVMRLGWRRDSWRVIIATTLLGTIAASGFVAMLAQTWRAAIVTAPVLAPATFASIWLGFRTGARLERSLHGD